MKGYVYKEGPLLLLSYSESSKEFTLSSEGKEFLSSLSSPISIIGVAGLYRTGKSYLLNRVLLNRKKGFGVGPTVNPCTKGIWIWGAPIKAKTITNQDCTAIILDTEGIGALDQDSDHDSRIFSLAVLICSCFIYNSVGSIDEEALSNLSLVVNLTKHIHIKSKKNEEVGTEEYAQYFPSFIWVVRDFALKLVDSEGESLTPKEYLEKALNAQKGFSDSAEEKNRIRRLLKEFFKDRDCCTLVRPVSSEQDLHVLEDVDLNSIRPEFLEQVEVLRNKVLSNAKPKTLNSSLLNGEMLVTLIESYVQAVNKGAVPNIENAWNYICKNQCSKALEEAQEIYNQKIQSLLTNNFPNSEQEIENIHKESKKLSLNFFKSKSLGDEAERSYMKLKEIIQEKYQQLKFQNEVEAEKQCLEFLRINYSNLNSKLKSGEYKKFLDFEREMRTLQQYFKEHGPKGPEREKLMLEYCQNKIIDAADIFIKQLYSEIDIIETTTAEKIKVLETDANLFKDEIVKEKLELTKKINANESQTKELIAKDNALLDQFNALKLLKEKVELELRNNIKKIKEDTSAEVKKANEKVWEYEEKVKNAERDISQKVSEFNQSYALMEQKLNFLERASEDLKKKEKELISENKSLAKTHASALKDLQSRLETQIRTLQTQLNQEIDSKASIERELEEKEKELQQTKNSTDDKIKYLQNRLEESSNHLKTITQTFDKKEKDLISKLAEYEKTHDDSILKITKKLEETEKKHKKTEEMLKIESNSLQKENAILRQKVEFLDTQCNDCKTQLDDERKQHSLMLLSLSTISDSSRGLELELEKLKEKHLNEIKYIEAHNESIKQNLLKELENFNIAKSEVELRYKLDSCEWVEKQQSFNEELVAMTQDRDKFKELYMDLKTKLDSVNLDNENKLKAKINELESYVNTLNQSSEAELISVKANAEKSYNQLKEFYDIEKKRLESKITEEKDKSDKKYKALIEEYEDRIRQESESHDEELASKEQELRELEAFMNEELTILKHQNSLDAQKILSLEKYIKEIKDHMDTIQKSGNSALEQSEIRFNHEKSILSEKIDRLVSENSAKDREISLLTYKKEQLEAQVHSKNEEISETILEIENTKCLVSKKIDELKQSNKKLSEELSTKKNDYKRESALNLQEIEFKSARIADLEKLAKDTEEKYRDTLKALKTENGQEMPVMIERLTSEKESLEKKLSDKKKDLKTLTLDYTKQISQLEKEKAILNEKITNMESKLSDIEYRNSMERDNLIKTLNIKKNLDDDPLSEEIEKLKETIEDLKRELDNKNNYIEKEKILWENKFNFLTQQKNSAKSDLNEAQRKFEFSLEQLHKRDLQGKEKNEISMNSLISSIESRYNTQLKDLQESSQSTIEHLVLKTKLMDQEIKSLKEELEIQRRNKNSVSGNIEQRYRQLQEIESKIFIEIESLRKSRNSNIGELKDSIGVDYMKNKIIDLEKRIKEAEEQKSLIYLELEKERARWQVEREHLLNAKNEAMETIEKIEIKKNFIIRENEKLRTERIKTRAGSKRINNHKTFTQLSGSPVKTHGSYSFKHESDSPGMDFYASDDLRRSYAN
jgi:Guanylate-binding protein, N-terminal domain/Guanylate-binding protein, C-terminal domain